MDNNQDLEVDVVKSVRSGLIIGILLVFLIGVSGFIVYNKLFSNVGDSKKEMTGDNTNAVNKMDIDSDNLSGYQAVPLSVQEKIAVNREFSSSLPIRFATNDEIGAEGINMLASERAKLNFLWAWMSISEIEIDGNIVDGEDGLMAERCYKIDDINKYYKLLFGRELSIADIESNMLEKYDDSGEVCNAFPNEGRESLYTLKINSMLFNETIMEYVLIFDVLISTSDNPDEYTEVIKPEVLDYDTDFLSKNLKVELRYKIVEDKFVGKQYISYKFMKKQE